MRIEVTKKLAADMAKAGFTIAEEVKYYVDVSDNKRPKKPAPKPKTKPKPSIWASHLPKKPKRKPKRKPSIWSSAESK